MSTQIISTTLKLNLQIQRNPSVGKHDSQQISRFNLDFSSIEMAVSVPVCYGTVYLQEIWVWVCLLPVLKLCVLIQLGRWGVSVFRDRKQMIWFSCLHVFLTSLLSLTQGVQCRLTFELPELRESRSLWMTNLQCLSFCLSPPFMWSASFLPVSPRV